MLLDPASCFARVIFRNSQQNRVFGPDIVIRCLELTELPLAERSPVAATEELQDDGFVSPKLREYVAPPRRVLELEIRCLLSDFDGRLGARE